MVEDKLLAEANRRFPLGSKYHPVGYSITTEVIKAASWGPDTDCIDMGVGYVYVRGKWAEAIGTSEKPINFTVGKWYKFKANLKDTCYQICKCESMRDNCLIGAPWIINSEEEAKNGTWDTRKLIDITELPGDSILIPAGYRKKSEISYPFKIGDAVEITGNGSCIPSVSEGASIGDIVVINDITFPDVNGGPATKEDPRYHMDNFNCRGKDIKLHETVEYRAEKVPAIPPINLEGRYLKVIDDRCTRHYLCKNGDYLLFKKIEGNIEYWGEVGVSYYFGINAHESSMFKLMPEGFTPPSDEFNQDLAKPSTSLVVCSCCEGSGETWECRLYPSEHTEVTVPCPRCNGDGVIVTADEKISDIKLDVPHTANKIKIGQGRIPLNVVKKRNL